MIAERDVIGHVRLTNWLHYKIEAAQVGERHRQDAARHLRLVRRALALPDLMQRLWEVSIDALYRDEIDDIEEHGSFLRGQVDHDLDVFRLLAATLGRRPLGEEGAEYLAECRRAILYYEELKSKIADEWPRIDATRMAASYSAFERGEGIPLEGFIRELQGGDSPGG